MRNKILVASIGPHKMIAILDDNNEVISRNSKILYDNYRLIDDNHIVDRRTIAQLCGMTEKQLTIEYDLRHCESEINTKGELVLAKAEFIRRSEEEIKAKLQYEEERSARMQAQLEAIMDAKHKAKMNNKNEK